MIYSIRNKYPRYGKFKKSIKYISPYDKSMIIDGSNILLCSIGSYDYYNESHYNYYKVNNGKCLYSLVKTYFYPSKVIQNENTWDYQYEYDNDFYYIYVMPMLVSNIPNSCFISKKHFYNYGWENQQQFFITSYYSFQYKNKNWYCSSFGYVYKGVGYNDNQDISYESEYSLYEESILGYPAYYKNKNDIYPYRFKVNSINNSFIIGNPTDVNLVGFNNKNLMIESAKLLIDKYNFKQKYEDQVIPQNLKIN